jgi:phosphohistidine phosphatase
MKNVIVVRHSKSDWSNIIPDFDRPVREDRRADAVLIAEEISNKGAIPQCVIASPAKRTWQTAKILCKTWGIKTKNILANEPLYEGQAKDILAAIHAASAEYHTIAIICHNPSITDFVNQYADIYIPNIPTTGAVCIGFDVNRWEDIAGKGKVAWFLRPKGLGKD